jgi:hypothetical protein
MDMLESVWPAIYALLLGVGVWLGAVLTASLVRSFGAAGGSGIIFLTKIAAGWRKYRRGDQSDTINVTLNTCRNGTLCIDTLVADRELWDVWSNPYLVLRLRNAIKACTADDPVVKLRTKKGRNDYRAIYDPLISLIAERCTNEHSLDLAMGRAMQEHRFVIALTYEKLCDIRAQHFRAMVIYEPELLNFPVSPPAFERPEYATRFESLKAIADQYKRNPHIFGIVKMWRPGRDGKAADMNWSAPLARPLRVHDAPELRTRNPSGG